MFNLFISTLMIVLEPIGYVHNSCTTSQNPDRIKQEVSTITVLPEYAEGLQEVEQSQYLDLIFCFHQEKRTELLSHLRTGEVRGVFASRSPRRPNHLGVTTVKLLRREGNTLYVEGADALDNSPVIDIKYCDTSLFDQQDVHQSIRVDSPRIDIVRHIMTNDTRALLLQAAQLHGHICPELALGVMGAADIMRKLYERQGDPMDYTLSVEMQNCPADGALFVTGCTPGTHRFVQGDPANMCFRLTNSAGKGWKVTLKESGREYMRKQLPDTLTPAQRGLATLELELAELLLIEEI